MLYDTDSKREYDERSAFDISSDQENKFMFNVAKQIAFACQNPNIKRKNCTRNQKRES